MKKIRFKKEQPEVIIKQFGETDFIFICLNGTEAEDEETGETFIEYDFNEIAAPRGKVDVEDVKENPGKYIDYVYEEEAELSVEEQLNDVQLALAEIYEMMIGE